MSLFTRQHHQAIAEVLARFELVPSQEPSEIELAARALANMFLSDNPNFNREKFLKACGMEGE